MDDTVGGQDVGGDNSGVVDVDGAVDNTSGDVSSLESLEGAAVHDAVAVDDASDNMIFEDASQSLGGGVGENA